MPFLYAVAMAGLLVYGLNLLWLVLVQVRNDRPPPVPAPRPDAWWPAVTVQIPLYNEALVAERVIDACAALDYPRRRLEVQVLDDSIDETTAIVAARVEYWKARGLNIVHVRRGYREGYKAGALQHGLQLAQGDLLAVFDADFVPPPDFLRRLVPYFDDPRVGLVQARWEHLNGDDNLLTRLQALGLDVHFAVEQQGRHRTGCFMSFNGTAGLWRRACIEDAGGWQADTLAEDLDLSYRAQLRGWAFRYAGEVAVPAELPVGLAALRAQQFRWTKGAAETARKLLVPLWRSGRSLRVKLAGTLHLTACLVFPCALLVTLLYAPLLLAEHLGRGPGPAYWACTTLGLFSVVGFGLARVFAQRALYPDWGRRLVLLPVFVAGMMGMAPANTWAVWQALRGRRTAFERTPKFSRGAEGGLQAWWKHRYAAARLPGVAWAEALLFAYLLAGLGVVLVCRVWGAVPFQGLLVLGSGMVCAANLGAGRKGRRK